MQTSAKRHICLQQRSRPRTTCIASASYQRIASGTCQAEAAEAAQRWAEAAAAFEAAAAVEPAADAVNAALWAGLCRSRARLGADSRRAALDACASALAIQPDDVATLVLRVGRLICPTPPNKASVLGLPALLLTSLVRGKQSKEVSK